MALGAVVLLRIVPDSSTSSIDPEISNIVIISPNKIILIVIHLGMSTIKARLMNEEWENLKRLYCKMIL